jgi:hypothetical protein
MDDVERMPPLGAVKPRQEFFAVIHRAQRVAPWNSGTSAARLVTGCSIRVQHRGGLTRSPRRRGRAVTTLRHHREELRRETSGGHAGRIGERPILPLLVSRMEPSCLYVAPTHSCVAGSALLHGPLRKRRSTDCRICCRTCECEYKHGHRESHFLAPSEYQKRRWEGSIERGLGLREQRIQCPVIHGRYCMRRFTRSPRRRGRAASAAPQGRAPWRS